jgi:hypothetical protein
MLHHLGRRMLLVDKVVAPLLFPLEVICKMKNPIHIGECIAWHVLLQRCDGIDWASCRPVIVDRRKSLDRPALLTSEHSSDLVILDDNALVRIEPPRLPPSEHEVRHLRSHPRCHESPERFTLSDGWQHPLKNFVVSYVAMFILHLLYLLVAHIDPKELVLTGVWNQLDVPARTLRAYFRPIIASCPKPSDQPRDAARQEECSDLDEKSLTTFCC